MTRICSRCGGPPKPLDQFTGSNKNCNRCKAYTDVRYRKTVADPQKRSTRLAYKRGVRAKENAATLARRTEVVIDEDQILEDDIEAPSVAGERIRKAEQRRVEMKFAYETLCKSETEIAKQFGLSSGYVHKELVRAGTSLRTRSEGTRIAMAKWYGQRMQKERNLAALFGEDPRDVAVCVDYRDNLLGLREVAKFHKRDLSTIRSILARHGIRLRSPKEQWDLYMARQVSEASTMTCKAVP